MSLSEQLEELRRKLKRIDARYQGAAPAAPVRAEATGHPDLGRDPDEGCEVETPWGRHWEIDRLWPAQFRHGNADVGALSELPADFLAALSAEPGHEAPVARWAFLDTETSGLAGGAGTFAFLAGVGWISERGFELKQFFMRDHSEESSLLHALAGLLARFDILVTYNGRAYDQPLLETRYRLARIEEPFPRLKHVDLLYSARRLWRLRLERCRLQDLERHILNVERQGDVEGALIPDLYFRYLRTGTFWPLAPVIRHNSIDILSLACLTAIVPVAFREPGRLTSGAEMVGLGRWLRTEGRLEEAAALLRGALKRPLADTLLWDTLWQLGELERKQGRTEAAVACWSELSTAANPWQARALERLAIYYEHQEKNTPMALEMTQAALALEPSAELRKREARLKRRASAPRSGRLL